MPIDFHAPSKTFLLQTPASTYALRIHGRMGVPLHLHWGPRVECAELLATLPSETDRDWSPEPVPPASIRPLGILPLELPVFGTGDFRAPALAILQPNGSRILDLRYHSHRIRTGKPQLPGLPATYVESDDEADSLEIELRDDLIGLRAVLQYTVFTQHDAITRSLRLENHGPDPLRIQRAASCSLDLNRSDFRLLELSGAWGRERHVGVHPLHPGTQSVESRRGASSHQHNPFIALLAPGADEDAGEVHGFSLVYSGSFLAQAEVDSFDHTRVSMGINPFDFEWRLDPSETFQTPEAVLVFSATGLGGMSRTFHRLYRTRLCRGNFRDAPRPVLLNNWEATYFKFDAEKLLAISGKAAELGVELFVLDDGWFGIRNNSSSGLGDWTVNLTKLPGGIGELARRVREQGLEFGLWFEPEMISPNSDLYRAHPDWCLHVPDRARTTDREQLVLDLTRPEVRSHIVEAVAAVLKSAPITYVKWDMNRNLTEAGSATLPADRQMEVGHRYILGVYEMMEQLTTRFPDVLFEGCAAGGGRFDPGILHYLPQIWASDDTDAIERLRIHHGTSVVYPLSSISAHVSAVPNHQVHRSTPISTRVAAATTGAFGYELDLNRLTKTEQNEVRQHTANLKDLRPLVASGDLYRLLSPFDGNETAWMIIAADGSEALVSYVRELARPNPSTRRLRLRGLDPRATYASADHPVGWTGQFLLSVGLECPRMEGDFQSAQWRLVKTNDPESPARPA